MKTRRPDRVPVIGLPLPRIDGWSKADGSEPYAADFFEPGMLLAGVKRAGVPSARVARLDTAGARALPGVVAVLPTALDVPDVASLAVETHEPSGPYGLKGAGEIGVNGPLPTVANAVADACGVRPGGFPLTPERVLAALGGQGERT